MYTRYPCNSGAIADWHVTARNTAKYIVFGIRAFVRVSLVSPDRVKTPLQSLRFRSGRLGALCGRFRQFSVKLRGLPHLTSLEFMWPGEPLSAPRGAQKLDGGHLCPHRRHQR